MPTTNTSWREGVAGACAGAMSRTILAPVERIKLVQQLTAESHSAWHVTRSIYQEDGLRSFWRGNLPSCLRVAGTAAINFTCMSYYKQVAHSMISMKNQRLKNFGISLVSGGLAGFTATTVLYPIEFVRTRLALDRGSQVQRQFRGGSWDVLSKIYQTDGWMGFYQGYGIAVTGGVVYRILLLGGYDALKSELLVFRQQRSRELSWWDRILVAQFISLTAGTISYPFDSVRRRMMMQAGMKTRKYRNSLHCIRDIIQNEGWKSFYRGLGPNIVRSVSGALLLVGYDSIRSVL